MNFTSLPRVLGFVFLVVMTGASQADAGEAFVNAGLLTRGMSTLAKIQKAQEEVASDSGVAAILKASALHQIAIFNRIETDGIETTRFQHFYHGVEVFGSQTLHHVGGAGSQVQNLLAKFDVSVQPTITAETATSIAQSILGGDRALGTAPELKIFPTGDDAARLVYFIDIAAMEDLAGRTMIIDAHSGEMLANLSKHLEVTPVQVFDTRFRVNQSPCQVLQGGAPVQFNLRSCAQVVSNSQARQGADASGVRALNNALRVLAYYASTFNRQSFDGRGTQLINVVHAGQRFANAFWDTEENMMAYGDGDGVTFGDMTAALDVAAHEMTHGVTAATAKLISMGESGALNEANSDFFGKLVSNDGWSVGRQVFVRPTPGKDAIRDLQTPGRLRGVASFADGRMQERPYPSTVREEIKPFNGCDDSNDRCNVHFNATIPGHAMYLMAQAVGKETAQKIQYATLTHALGPNTTFRQYGAAIRQVCSQLYDARTCQAVAQAYASVGL